ncbi:MAG: SDR family oxidoreductase [Pirellulaceae bacterium]|nr:SDR family oxidoreductase [Pirellulaceae bacterium]
MELASILSLEGRVALITGAGSGIGKSTAKLFSRAGAKLALLGRDHEELQATAQRISGESCILVADVAKPNEMELAVSRLIDKFGRLDVVVANAGINGVWAALDALEPEEWNETIGVNLTGAFLTMKYAVPHLRKTRGNVIINASINGTRVFSNCGATAYACSKAAQVTLAKMTALELARDGIRVNVVCPGSIATPIHNKTVARELENVSAAVEYPEGTVPLTQGEVGAPAEVAQLMLFLASDAAKHITGTEIWIDGGESLLMG